MQHPMLLIERLPKPQQRLFQLIIMMRIKLERLADAATAYDYVR
jgi:hypothetical protein